MTLHQLPLFPGHEYRRVERVRLSSDGPVMNGLRFREAALIDDPTDEADPPRQVPDPHMSTWLVWDDDYATTALDRQVTVVKEAS